MRNMLLASVFALGAVGTVGTAIAQTRPAAAPAPVSGPVGGYVGTNIAPAPIEIAPWNPLTGQLIAKPGAYVGANNNNNSFGTAKSGPSGNPTPGTMVIHLNGRVIVQYNQAWNSLMNSAPGFSTQRMPSSSGDYPPKAGRAFGFRAEAALAFPMRWTPKLFTEPEQKYNYEDHLMKSLLQNHGPTG